MNTIIRILYLCLTLLPLQSLAQSNITKAFDKLINNSSVTVKENHSLEKDTDTGKKKSQYDLYRFTMPKNKMNLVKDIEKAFRQDTDKAYSISSGTRDQADNPIYLAIGDGNGTGAILADRVGASFIFSCFLDPDDANGYYRYAYAMDWLESDDQISGTLIMTYSTTLKYRQQKAIGYDMQTFTQSKRPSDDNFSATASFFGDPVFFALTSQFTQSWFSQFMTYVSSMETADRSTRQALASYIFEITKNTSQYPEVNAQDKNAAREILQSMIIDKRYSADSVLHSLLSNCLKNLE